MRQIVIIIGANVPMQLVFAFSYHLLQQQVRFSGQRPGRKLPLAIPVTRVSDIIGGAVNLIL